MPVIPSTHFQRLVHPVRFWAEQTPDAAALTEGDITWSYSQLGKAVDQAVLFMRSLGIRAGHKIMLVGENGLTLATLILAAGELDAWVVLENARRAPHEVDITQKQCQARRVLYATSNSEDAKAHAIRRKATVHVTDFGVLAASDEDANSPPEPVYPDAESQVATLIYTTGSTGVPKGVMLTHANLLHIATMMRSLRRLTSADKVYGVLPITHVMGLSSVFLGTLLSGAHLHLVARFSSENCTRTLTGAGITILQGAPAMFAKLTQYIKKQPQCVFHLRFIAAGGAPIDPTIKAETEELFNLVLHNGYGLTEAAATCWTRLEDPRNDCSVGLPGLETEIRILDRQGQAVPIGETGELWVRGPNVMKGYYRAPELTSQVLTADGWFNTQDLARMEPHGNVYIEGRTRDLIIRSGFNVYPLEVESALNSHPKVVHSAVLGRRRNGNEEVVAFVERSADGSVSELEIQQFLTELLSPYKRPAEIVFMALPVAPNGKVLKHQLKKLLEEKPPHE